MDLIPAQGRAVLALIQEHAPLAYLAGGALRDAWFGRPIKDLDFFVPYMEGHNAIHSALLDAGYTNTVVAAMQYFADDPTVADARLYEQPGQLPVNVIRLRVFQPCREALNRFDLGFCQIGFDGRNVHTTNAFAIDEADLTMTLTRCESPAQFERTEARAERLREKYREWLFVVPDKFKQVALA
ncbi:hypothetical protein AncyloWKF20_07595 [Ancylobacter sp. WKF20]|uniref:hypothetical protein n=1 Tax=Ancylobacter sp. WKF20 TaxID=3039801 RepID=UPI00243411C2|nr:hypothetical protein [Ancylobacter sp. WKF20]WGD31673.1 hypothetical protein AncyloWKF20_07595 [Ancylobacter sp. WKF20]